MHISDGVLSAPVIVSGWAVTLVVAGVTLRRMRGEEIPKTAVITSVFFVASLIHIPLGPVSIHLILNGLVGIILGYGAYPSILLGLTLQAILFQHGGVVVLGVNAVIMGLPAITAHWLFGLRHVFKRNSSVILFGFSAGVLSTAFSGILVAVFLVTTGKAFIPAARLALIAHLPVMLIEGAVTAAAVSYLAKVKPHILLSRNRGSVKRRS
jgi:cobalt/nickel transport system permease protein